MAAACLAGCGIRGAPHPSGPAQPPPELAPGTPGESGPIGQGPFAPAAPPEVVGASDAGTPAPVGPDAGTADAGS